MKTDRRLIKIIHDLKNPIIACKQVINDNDYNFEQVKKITNQELQDLEDMLDNLRLDFKSKNFMNLEEQHKIMETEEFITSL